MSPDAGRRTTRLSVFILILAVPVVAFLVFHRMYGDDVKVLKNFIAVYQRFDRAVSDLEKGQADGWEREAGDAVKDLGAKASLRLSSLIKNDAGLMDQALEVADLAQKEFESLGAEGSRDKSENVNAGEMAGGARLLTVKRKAAYARFQELGGVH